MSDMNDNELEVLAGLDFDTFTPEDVIDVSKLDAYELSCLNRDTRERLMQIGEMNAEPHQRSEEGKALHSTFLATVIEMGKRNRDGR